MNVKTTDPHIVEMHITNCADMQQGLTDFIQTLNDFPTETIISNIYQYNKVTTDSIYADIEFYTQMEQSSLQIKDNTKGATTLFLDNVPSISMLYGNLGKYEKLVLDDTGNPTFRNNNTEVLITTNSKNQIWRSIDTKINADMDGLPSNTGLENLTTWFLMYWLEKYRTSHKIVRDIVLEQLPNSVYYTKFSESIGCVKNIEFINTSTTTDLTDPVMESNNIPYVYPGTINYIASDNVKRVSMEMSKQTNVLFRKNVVRVLNDPYHTPGDSNKSHGADLVTDELHYNRMRDTIRDIHTVLQNTLQDMYRVLIFTSNNINSLKVPAIVYNQYIEGMRVDLDILKNKAKRIISNRTIDNVLKAY